MRPSKICPIGRFVLLCTYISKLPFAHRTVLSSLSHTNDTKGRTPMKTINLRDYYPYYTRDTFVDLPDEVIAAMKPYKTEEQSHRRRMRWKKVYSLDVDGMENHVLFTALSPCELYERKLTYQELYAAITDLPDKQAQRIYAHFFMRMSMSAIARSDGVSRMAVGASIERGLQRVEKRLKASNIPFTFDA